MTTSARPGFRGRERALAAFVAIVGAGAFTLDLLLPTGVACGILYILLVLLGLLAARPRFTVITACIASVLTLGGGLASLSPNPFWLSVANRGLVLVAIWVIAALVVQRSRAEHQRAADRETAEHYLDIAEVVIVALDAKGRISLINRKGCSVLECRADEAIGADWFDNFIPESERQTLRTVFREIMKGVSEAKARYENPVLTKTGRERLIEWRNTVLRDKGGAPIGTLSSGLDITEYRRAQEALRESEERFRNVVEFIPDGIIVHADGKTLFANPAAVQLVGAKSADKLVGRPVLEAIHPDYREIVQKRIRDAVQEGKTAGLMEEKFLRVDGETVDVEVTSRAVTFEGRPAVVSMARDIRERKRAEEERRQLESQIQHAQKLESLGVLAGGIAHDFNNLLVGILGNAGLAKGALAPESPAKEKVERIETAARRAAELTNQMLAYSGKGKFVVQAVNLNRLIDEMAHLLETVISKKASLVLRPSETDPIIKADVSQARQIVMNLITNASDALDDRSGTITISTGVVHADRAYLSASFLDEDLPEGPYAFIEVSDTGLGMDEEIQQRIFDPFFTTKFTGRGLGLAAVLGIVRGHRGAIRVYSQKHRGTTIKILLPFAEDAVSPPAPEAKEVEGWRGSGTVLVVDDEPTVREVSRSILEMAGFTVLTAADGEKGLEIYREHGDEISIVLLDMTMPRMSGEETFRELRKLRPGVKVILTSGYNEQDATDRFAGKGLAGFIQKPYPPSALLAKVRTALEKLD
jgi:PAS domain S-box-containing protein